MPKGDRKKNKETKVEMPIIGGTEVAVPEYFATQLKSGKWKLVNPITHSRNLSRRKGQLSIKLLRKPVDDMVIMSHQTEPIPLADFSKKDRDIINNHFQKVETHKGKEVEEIPTKKTRPGLERGRPEYLEKNVEENRSKGIKPNKTKRVYVPVNTKKDDEEGEEEEQPKRKRGRKAIYATEEERKAAKRAHNRASYRRIRDENKVNGGSIIDDIKGGINSVAKKIQQTTSKATNAVVKTAKNTSKAVGDYADVVFNGRNDYPPKVRDLLNKYGNEVLNTATIVRAPVPSLLTNALSLVSGGQFGKNLANSPYDTLFHLRLDFTTQNGNKFMVEKNEVINMDKNPSMPKDAEKKEVQPISSISINAMLENAKKYMDGKYFNYSARDNNCQDFILAILNANQFGNDADRGFVKQNTKELFNNMPALRKFSNTITDLGAKVNEITTGRGLTEDVINHFEKDNNEMKKLSKSFKKHLKTEKMTGGRIDENDCEAESMAEDIGGGLFDKMDWGTLTAQFKTFRRKNKSIKSLDEFAHYIINHPTEFRPKTKKRAEFYVNVIKKGEGINKISHNNIMPPKRSRKQVSDMVPTIMPMDNVVSGRGRKPKMDSDSDSDSDMEEGGAIHHHHYHTTEIDGNGIVHHHHHHVMDGGRLSKIGQAFNKAFNPQKNGVAKAVQHNIVNPIENNVVHPIENTTNKAVAGFNKTFNPALGRQIENGAKVVGHYVIPATTSALGGLAGTALGALAGPGTAFTGGIAGSALGAYGGQQIDRALGIQNNTSFDGKGIRKAKFVKGSQEAKDYMASLRAKRKGGNGLYASGRKGCGNGLYAGNP